METVMHSHASRPLVEDTSQLKKTAEIGCKGKTALNCCRVEVYPQTTQMVDFSNETVAIAYRDGPTLLPLITALEAGEVHQAWPYVPWINNEVRVLWSVRSQFPRIRNSQIKLFFGLRE
jgi:hypothetical protein